MHTDLLFQLLEAKPLQRLCENVSMLILSPDVLHLNLSSLNTVSDEVVAHSYVLATLMKAQGFYSSETLTGAAFLSL
jgi:hypothetical protein